MLPDANSFLNEIFDIWAMGKYLYFYNNNLTLLDNGFDDFDMIMIPYTIIHFPISRLFVILVSFEMSLIRLEAKKL